MWLVTGATGHIGNVLIRKLLETVGEIKARYFFKLKVPFDLARFAAVFTPMYYSHSKATQELGYQPRPLYESIRDAMKWFLEKK